MVVKLALVIMVTVKKKQDEKINTRRIISARTGVRNHVGLPARLLVFLGPCGKQMQGTIA